MPYRSEVRITEERVREDVRVLAPATAEDSFATAQGCADQHLFAELQGRWVQERPMPYRVEVRVWEDEAGGFPAATAEWDEDHGVLRRRDESAA
ncbi:hypothetical protein [Streptacidiphilus anmyonensis]|uniref:hypothetical protein n=1 Tax=Streptacidiphilus anmyonensis TaxID=405782 RepID=UPI0005A99F67|nr:hypothetical protein [Streptacidiphilus anmyonensis]